MVRRAKLVIDPAKLEAFKAILKEEIEASLKLEPGVQNLFAVSEIEDPTHITILEIYADAEAYQAHLKTPHFLKYKNSTQAMVLSLELIEVLPLITELSLRSR